MYRIDVHKGCVQTIIQLKVKLKEDEWGKDGQDGHPTAKNTTTRQRQSKGRLIERLYRTFIIQTNREMPMFE